MDLLEILDNAVELGSSDVHIKAGLSPIARINGEFHKLQNLEIDNDIVYNLICQIAGDDILNRLNSQGEVDFSTDIHNNCRIRVNAYKQKGDYAIAIRLIPNEVPKFESLKLPDVMRSFVDKNKGLVLVTGPTGSGKSTTLASLIDLINESRSVHILTLEDPIEYLHMQKKGIVNQREVGVDTRDFSTGLRASLRQDPDVILIGEMRDAETMEIALRAAETGHLVFSTMHTIGAAKTIDRIIDSFEPSKQQQIRGQLSTVLTAIISQQLIQSINKKSRVLATEVMIANTAVRNLIRENKIYQIQNIIQTSSKQNMYSMDQDLCRLCIKGLISKEKALSVCNDSDYIRKILHY